LEFLSGKFGEKLLARSTKLHARSIVFDSPQIGEMRACETGAWTEILIRGGAINNQV